MNSHALSQKAAGLALCIAVLMMPPALAFAGQGDASGQRSELKNQVVSLVEDRLSKALSFQRRGEMPDFSTLDEIHPGWDNGDPGKARRTWVDRNWYYHLVKYRVDSVFLTSMFTARVRGKKRVRYGQDVDFMILFDRESKVDSSTHFVMDLYRDAKGDWYIRAENEF